MDIEKKINNLIEEYELFYSGTMWEFLESKDIDLHSKITTVINGEINTEALREYHLERLKLYIRTHPETTFKDLCSRDSLWYW